MSKKMENSEDRDLSSVGHAEKDTSSLLKSLSRSLKAQGVSEVRYINDNKVMAYECFGHGAYILYRAPTTRSIREKKPCPQARSRKSSAVVLQSGV